MASLLVAGIAVSLRTPTRDHPVVRVPCSGDPATDGESLRHAVQSTAGGVIQLADDCTYSVGPINGPSTDALTLEDKRDLTIRGVGAGRTRISLARDVYVGFNLLRDIDGLTIADLTIEGAISDSGPALFCGGHYPLLDRADVVMDKRCNAHCPAEAMRSLPNTHGIRTEGRNVHRLRFAGLEIHRVAVGISIAGACDGSSTCTQVVIEDNDIHDLHGTCSWSGTGISTGCVRDIVVRRNTVARTERHGIYHARTQEPLASPRGDNVLIADNVIVDHRRGPLHDGDQHLKVALVIARSSYVTAISNVIVNSRSIAISAEYNEHLGTPVERIFFISNRVLGPTFNSTGKDIWINTRGTHPVTLWFNRRNEAESAPTLITSGSATSPEGWAGTQWIETGAGDGLIYVMKADTLYRVTPHYQTSPAAWPAVRSTTFWADFQSMATAGDGYVYVMRGNMLHRIAPEPETEWWFHWYALQDWTGVTGVTAMSGQVYVMRGDCLHRVAPENRIGEWSQTERCGVTPVSAMRAGPDQVIWMYRDPLAPADTAPPVAPPPTRLPPL